MKQRNKVVLIGLVIAFLAMMMIAAGQTTTKELYPANVTEDHEGEKILVKGQVHDLSKGDVTKLRLVGRYGASIDVIYEGVTPGTLEEERYISVKGTLQNGKIHASKLVVDAHSGEDGGPPGQAEE